MEPKTTLRHDGFREASWTPSAELLQPISEFMQQQAVEMDCEVPLEQVGVDVTQAACEVVPLEVHATVETELLPQSIDTLCGQGKA